MKRYFLFVLIFFLVFSFYFKPVNAGATDCHFYIDGICQTWYYFDSEEYEEFIKKTVEAPEETIQEIKVIEQPIITEFFSLVFQFFGIVILFILLVILLESVLEPK